MTIELLVNGMTCGNCVSAVTGTIKSLDPHAAVQVDLPSGRARVDAHSPATQLIKALSEAGYPATMAAAQAVVTAPKRGGCCCGS